VLWNAPAGVPDAASLFPTIRVPLYSTDYFARFDPVMAIVLGRGTGSPARPAGDVITVNAASFRTEQGIAPGSFAAVFGNYAVVPDSVSIGGNSAAVVAATTSQVNCIVPGSVPPGRTEVIVSADGKSLGSGTLTISRSGPGIFVLDPASANQPGAVLNEDGTVNTPLTPAPSGSVLQIFGTGYGEEFVRAYVAERPAEVLFSGNVPQFPGLWQVNARLPSSITVQVSLFLFSGTLSSNGVTVWVK
jgi:uncharacterized protein (TIGR03437 family)